MVRTSGPATERSKARHLIGAVFGAMAAIMLVGAAPAAAENRTLDLYNTHTKERLTITFKKNGRYVQSALTELNRFLRDWRRNEPTNMDPRLFDTVWEVYTRSGARQPIHVVSAYRSLTTNNMLRSRSKGVAKHSQHTLGKAMDFFLPDVGVAKLREIGVSMQRGGVGYYPNANSPFVHIDVGSVRAWPRMTRTQLTRIFPDGKTVHLPSDGKPLAGYQQALAEMKRNGGVTRPLAVADENGGSGKKIGLLAMLFGGDEEDETTEMDAASGAEEAPAAAPRRTAPAAAPAPVAVAAAPIPPKAPDQPSVRSLAEATLPAGAAEVEVAAGPPPPVPRGRPKNLDTLVAAADAAAAEAAIELAALDVTPRPRPESETELPVATAAVATDEAAGAEPANARMALAEVVRDDAADAPESALGYASPIDTAPVSGSRPPIRQASLTAPPAAFAPSSGRADPLKPLAEVPADEKANPLAVLTAPPATVDLPVYDSGQSTYWGVFATLSHPDQRTVSTLFADPALVVMTGFSGQPYAGMSSLRFAGEALPRLPVLILSGNRDFALR